MARKTAPETERLLLPGISRRPRRRGAKPFLLLLWSLGGHMCRSFSTQRPCSRHLRQHPPPANYLINTASPVYERNYEFKRWISSHKFSSDIITFAGVCLPRASASRFCAPRERVGGGSPDDARWDARKKERAAEEGFFRSPDLRKKEGWDFGQRRVGGGSPDDGRWDLRKRTRGSPDDARWDLQKKRREEEERNGGGSPEPDLGKKNDDEEKKKKVVVVARGEEEVKRGKWCAGMRVPWVEEGPHMLYAGPSFLAGAAPDPSSLPIPSFGPPRRRTSSSGGGVAVRVALIFLAGLVLRLLLPRVLMPHLSRGAQQLAGLIPSPWCGWGRVPAAPQAPIGLKNGGGASTP
uniref:Uncharacterized protein n=2 Tax=Oryza glumipatula TaxID=40148 RepID=A0A0D9YQB3_9ORYZ